MKRTRLWTAGLAGLFALVGAFALASGASAQAVTTSAVTGRVTNSQGEPIASAQVVVKNTQTGTTNGGLTGNDGRFYIPYLRPGGPYTVTASSIGHKTVSREGLTITLGQDLRVDFQLPEQAVQLKGLEVTAEANPTFSPSKTGAQTIVTQQDINNLPTITRNFSDFAVLSPLVSVTGAAPSVGGQNNRYNNIQIDGAVNNDVFGLASSGLPGGQANGKAISLEAIKEFQVLVAPFDVRQAGFTGGLINAVTKSGTNQFKGSAYVYYRNQNFVGTVNLPGTQLKANDFKSAQYGFTLGGPIIRNRLHFFVAAELEQHNTPTLDNIDTSSPSAIGVSPDSMARFVSILQGYGVNPGTPNQFTRKNPLNNLFARIDWQLNENNRLTIHDSYNTASDQSSPSRGGFYYTLSSYTYNFKNSTNTAVAQLFSSLSPTLHNELLFNYERVRDRRNPLVDYGTVQVNVGNDVGGSVVSRRFEAGAEYYSQGNQLDQDIVQLTDNLTKTFGAHQVTLGTSNEYLHFRNLFFPGSYGRWSFGSLSSFAANDPSSYEISLPFPGISDPAARFGVAQIGGYLEDEWTVNNQFTLTYGLRVDVPFMLDSPRQNPTFATATGINTSDIPSGNPLWSPRVGFNWQPNQAAQFRTQVRGGVGIFSGRPPYVWMSNAYGNTGRETVSLYCSGGNAPGFSPTSPTTCADGTGVSNPSSGTLINIFAKNFKFPQDLKLSLAVDQDLPWGMVGTLEGLYTKAVSSIFLQDINIPSTPNASPGSRLGIGDRPIYGTPTARGFSPNRVYPQFDQIVEGVNKSTPYSYSLVAELKKSFGSLLDVRASYTYQRAYDNMSLTSSIATSNFGYNPISGNPNDPATTVSDFDRPSKVLFSATLHALPQYGGTDVTALYVGQSGRPYSYVYYGDVNGDGYPGSGVASGRTNDLVYVPKSQSDIVMSSPSDWQLLQEAINLDPCLSKAQGTIMKRNSCRNPWTNELDLRIEQGVPAHVGNVKIVANIFNFLNLLNNNWGRQKGSLYNTNSLLSLEGRDANGNLVFSYDGRTTKNAAGQTVADLPYTTFFPSSAWQIQLGLRYSF